MLITLTSGGSRGDSQPYIALAHGFKAAGHRVRMVTTPDYAPLVEGADFDCRFVNLNIRSLIESERGRAMLAAGGNPFMFLRRMRQLLEPFVEPMIVEAKKNFAGSDAFVMPSSGAMFGSAAFEWLNIPFCTALMQPLAATSKFAHPFFPPLDPRIPGAALYNRFTYAIADFGVAAVAGPVVRRALRGAGVGKDLHRSSESIKRPLLFGYSPLVVKPPTDWPPNATATGYWFLDLASAWTPPAGLVDFVNAGPPPVSIGFGSMNNSDPAAATKLVADALRLAGQRGILLSGWGGLATAALPDNGYMMESAPHDWLFPRMAAVVHHCGAGTTGAGLRAGVPAVPVPFFADQLFWARRLHELGVAPRPVPWKKLTAENLAQAIHEAVTNKEIKIRSEELGKKIRAEDGVGVAVEIAENYFCTIKR
ncbi:MAG TPA: glycosyltransferase [Chitinivibrionales bacterium]|nr:glycosyltransferase [Chitinivibrionales bacterium]